MDESNAEGLRDTLDFFILNRFCERPLSRPEIQSRLQPVFRFLALAGAGTPKQSSELVLATVERLQREGWLKSEPRSGQEPDAEIVFALTAAGHRRIQAEVVRQRSAVAQFVEDDDMDQSFGKFLSVKGLPYAT